MDNINDLLVMIIPVVISFCFLPLGLKIARFLFSHFIDVNLYHDDIDVESKVEDVHIDFHNSNKEVTKENIDEDMPIRHF